MSSSYEEVVCIRAGWETLRTQRRHLLITRVQIQLIREYRMKKAAMSNGRLAKID